MTRPAAELACPARGEPDTDDLLEWTARRVAGAGGRRLVVMIDEVSVLVGTLEKQEEGRGAGLLHDLSEVVADRVRVFGSAHPDTLKSRRVHTFWLDQSGRAGEAVMRLAEVVADEVRVLGLDHPGTHSSQSYLASMIGQVGSVGEAGQLCRDMLRDDEGLSDGQRAELLRALIRHAMEGVPAERRPVVEADIASIVSTANSVLRGEAGVDRLPPELRPAFEDNAPRSVERP